MFKKYNYASASKTNDTKTKVFWISDWLDAPPFSAKIEKGKCNFLGIPIDTNGQLPKEDVIKMINNIKMQIGLWSSINLSMLERAKVLKSFITSKLVYWSSLMLINKDTIRTLQRMFNSFFWGKTHPFQKIPTCVGKKEEGGFGLIHLESMIISYRIKYGLLITSETPKLWKLFALLYVGLHLHKLAPQLWSNLIPHFNHEENYFGEVAINTATWFKRGGNAVINAGGKSIYWNYINAFIFRAPICYERVNHLKDIFFLKMIHHSKLTSNMTEFWTSLANYGINTRDRLEKTIEEKKCLFCPLPETLTHLFITCSYFDEMFQLLFKFIENKFNIHTTRNEYEIIYLKILSSTTSSQIQKQITYTIGNYLFSIWSYRCIINNGGRKNHYRRCQELFIANMKYLPFDNG